MARHKSYDLTIVKEVRTKTLADILEVLNETDVANKFGDYKKQMLLKLATTVLPRINELSGRDGESIEISGVDIILRKNESEV